jgi:hypothetical protein
MKKTLIKTLLVASLLIALFEVALTQGEAPNPFKSDDKVKHSLFKDANTWNRLSGDPSGVPAKRPN